MATILVPYVLGMLSINTYRVVTCSGFYYRLVRMNPDDEGQYGRLLRRLWANPIDLIICEHDVEPTLTQLQSILLCGHDWCSYNYDSDLYPDGPSHGLVRYSRRLMARHPLAAEVALVTGKRRDTEAEWWRVDSLMARDLMIRGEPWQAHEGLVHHAHQGVPSGPP